MVHSQLWKGHEVACCQCPAAVHPRPHHPLPACSTRSSPADPPQVTHLVVGDERRTLKLMLAVANGAWLVSPQWVTASLEAGRWLPESQFPAKVKAKGAAQGSHCAQAPPLLRPAASPACPVPPPPQVRFETAAARARALLEVPDAPPLLGDHAVYVHLPDKARKLMGANAAALRRVAGALGAKVRVPGPWRGRWRW